MHAVVLYVTAEKANDHAHLAHLGSALESLQPTLVRRMGGNRVIAQFMVDANGVHAAVEVVADLVAPYIHTVPGVKLAYVRSSGITSVIHEGAPEQARLSGDPGYSKVAVIVREPMGGAGGSDEWTRKVDPSAVPERTLTVEQALDDARRAVDEALS